MFKSEAKLFLSANNNVNSAKTLINECKRLIVDFNLEGNSDCKNLKSNINNCNINALVTKIEDTKESLMKLDQGFASEYMTLLQEFLQTSTIDTSNMTDEEKMQYSIQMDAYARDYNQNLLYMLEKYEESGMLTDEMKQQLQYQRELVTQYDIQDKMAVLDPTTDEYINLFKQCADYDRKLINLNPSLTEAEKTSYLKEYNTQYNQNLDALINARDARLKREKDEKELEELYEAKENNSNFWHPFVESEINEAILDKKIEMGIASEDEIAYKNMNGWDRFLTDTGTFAASTFTGLFNITEGIGDGAVMLSSVFGNEEYKTWASEYISRDISGELYQGIQLSNDMNTYSAYGDWHDTGEAFGGFVGKVGMSFAAPWASALLSGFNAMGQSAETAFNSGDDYWTALAKSTVSGIGGAAEGYAYSKLNLGIRNFVSSGTLKTLGKTALSNIKNFPTPISGTPLKTLAWNGTKKFFKTAGTSLVSTLIEPDALIETGCVIANNVIEGATTGEWDFGKMVLEAGAVFGTNWIMNIGTDLAFGSMLKTGQNTTTNNEYLDSVNSDNRYKVDNRKEFAYAENLRSQGRTDWQIANTYAAKATKCANIKTKNKLYDFAYEYLARSTSSAHAEQLVREAFENQLSARGMTTVFTDSSGIKYNVINGFNSSNQAFDLEYIRQQLEELPPEVRSSVREINIYDTRCPSDKYWSIAYNDPNFRSAATAGGGTINLWANGYKDGHILKHEAAHCFDSAYTPDGSYYIGKYSQSPEYIAAVQEDLKLSGSTSVTSYGGNNLGEDFADAFAMYKGIALEGRSIDQFPNRKAFFDKLINEGVFTAENIGIGSTVQLAPSVMTKGGTVPGLKRVDTSVVESEILQFYNNAHPNSKFGTFDELIKADPDAVKAITYDNYRLRVASEKVSLEQWAVDKRMETAVTKVAQTKAKSDGKLWEDLTYAERNSYKMQVTKADVPDEMLIEIYDANLESSLDLADHTIERVEKLISDGYVKDGYTSDQIIRMIQDDVPQTTYLKESYVDDYYKKWNADPDTGKTKVVMFQNGEGRNFSNCEGNNIGPDDGAYVMPEKEAFELIEKCKKLDGTIDTDMLTRELGGVQFGENVIMITQEVEISDIRMPNGSLTSAYLGDWCPGGKTSGIGIKGCTEGIVPQKHYTDPSVTIEVIQGPKTKDSFISEIK